MESNSETDQALSFPPRKILLAIDGSDNAERAAQIAIDLAKRYKANLIVLSIVPRIGALASAPTDYYDYYERMIQKWIDEVIEDCQRQAVSVRGRIIRAQPSIPGAIVEVAELEDVDMIVMGRRGLTMLKGGFRRALAGSVSSAVVSHAHCNVLIVK